MQDNRMSLVEHLGELRKRIVWILIVLVVTTVLGLVIADPIIHYLKHVKPASEMDWNVFSPWDSMRIYMQFAFAVAMVISLPFILFQLWAFVKPGLRERERKASLMYIPFAVLLFLLGLAFGYFILFPMAFLFTEMMTNNLDLKETYGISQYFSFMFNIIIPISFLFELPVAVMFLTKIRLLNPMRLHRFRRYAYFILLIIGAVITPPDLVSALIVTIPMIILYEFSILLSRLIYRKQQAADKAWEAEYGAK